MTRSRAAFLRIVAGLQKVAVTTSGISFLTGPQEEAALGAAV
jgi:hypothetical protein